MTSTKRINTVTSQSDVDILDAQIERDIKLLNEKLERYQKLNGKSSLYEIKKNDGYDYINPSHYVQDDGRQTWEHMVDEFGLEETAIFCKLNAYKYSDRRGKKPGEDTEREDKKIKWYEDKASELYDLHNQLKNKNDGNTWFR